MADEFLIADTSDPDPLTWTSVSTLLSNVSGDITVDRALEWEFQPYAKAVTLGDGTKFGVGYPIVSWKFGALRPEQRENLKDFCATLSGEVYIRTPTNETSAGARVWKDYRAIMKWTEGYELVGVNYVEEVHIQFTHCVVQGS